MFLPLRLAAVAHQANPQRSKGSPPRAAQRRGCVPHLPFCRTGHHGKRPVFDGLVRFADFEMQWNGNGACAVAVQRNGEAANWRSPARPRAEACRYLVQGTPHKWRLADAGLFWGGAIATGNQFTNFSCRPRAKIIRQPEALDNPETFRQPTTPISRAG